MGCCRLSARAAFSHPCHAGARTRAAGLIALAPGLALAQDPWPAKQVTLVVPFPPGGTSDVIGRLLAQRLKDELGQTFVVENKAGAATAIGAGFVARAPKDGHTILLSAGSTFTVNPNFNDKLAYKLDDFEPVAPVASGLDIKLTQVHYKGAAPATVDMLAGVIDSNVEALTSAVPNINAGQYRALAVLSAERLPLLPDVPTFRELGHPSVVGEIWFAVFAPAGTPRPVVDKLNAALRRITTSASFGEAMRKIGNEAKSGSPAELRATTLEQAQLWGDLIKRLGIKAE